MRVGFHGCFHRTGFPYGHFNGETVKDQIHEPDGHTSERVVSPAYSLPLHPAGMVQTDAVRFVLRLPSVTDKIVNINGVKQDALRIQRGALTD